MCRTILDRFERTVDLYPNRIAIEDEDGDYSFSEIRAKALFVAMKVEESLAGRTHSSAIPVIVFMRKSAKAIISMLGVSYARCVYVPIDKDMPEKRMSLVLDNLQPALVVVEKREQESIFSDKGYRCLIFDELVFDVRDTSMIIRNMAKIKSTDLQYILYTSGSTGAPKGVTVSHLAAMDFLNWIMEKYRFDENTSLCSQAPLYFDASVPDYFIMLASGATLYIPPSIYYTFPKKILQYIEDKGINTLIWVPSALMGVVNTKAFDVCRPKSLRLVIFCGEVMPTRHLSQWRREIPNARYVNMYGPTEAVYACTYYEIENEIDNMTSLPLGKPCENSAILVLNGNELCETGEIGELCILGQCLSSGYYNDKVKTEAAFVQNPLNPSFREILYRTGDLGYYDKDGILWFCGRKDFQIKRLGHRIELGEIENVMMSNSKIESCCCIYKENKQEIVALYVGDAGEDIGEFVAERLPSYMVPNRYVKLIKMPLNQNGKIDRKALTAQINEI